MADLPWDDGIPHRDGAWTFTATGTTSRSPFPALSDAERVRHKGRLVYPNLLLSLSADHVAAFMLIPRAAGHTTVICDFLFAPDAVDPGFDPADAVEFWDLVNRQDWRIGESVQQGMSSFAAERGWFAPMEDDSRTSPGGTGASWGMRDRRAGTPVPEAGSGRLDADVAIVGLGGIGSDSAVRRTAWPASSDSNGSSSAATIAARRDTAASSGAATTPSTTSG